MRRPPTFPCYVAHRFTGPRRKRTWFVQSYLLGVPNFSAGYYGKNT